MCGESLHISNISNNSTFIEYHDTSENLVKFKPPLQLNIKHQQLFFQEFEWYLRNTFDVLQYYVIHNCRKNDCEYEFRFILNNPTTIPISLKWTLGGTGEPIVTRFDGDCVRIFKSEL